MSTDSLDVEKWIRFAQMDFDIEIDGNGIWLRRDKQVCAT
jgi:hypothetical protein